MKSLLLTLAGTVVLAGLAMAAGDETLARRTCTTCHNFTRVEGKFGEDRATWEARVGRMLAKSGAPKLSDAERKAVIDWLAAQKK